LSVSYVILACMTQCNVQKCLSAANEAVEPLLLAGPLCDDHRARLLAGEDWELQGSQPSLGTAQPTVLMGDSLLGLNEYVLLEPPSSIESGGHHGDVVPLRVHRRGEPDDRELNLLIKPDMLPAIADFFQHIADTR
jgi:hypothetical protein